MYGRVESLADARTLLCDAKFSPAFVDKVDAVVVSFMAICGIVAFVMFACLVERVR